MGNPQSKHHRTPGARSSLTRARVPVHSSRPVDVCVGLPFQPRGGGCLEPSRTRKRGVRLRNSKRSQRGCSNSHFATWYSGERGPGSGALCRAAGEALQPCAFPAAGGVRQRGTGSRERPAHKKGYVRRLTHRKGRARPPPLFANTLRRLTSADAPQSWLRGPAPGVRGFRTAPRAHPCGPVLSPPPAALSVFSAFGRLRAPSPPLVSPGLSFPSPVFTCGLSPAPHRSEVSWYLSFSNFAYSVRHSSPIHGVTNGRLHPLWWPGRAPPRVHTASVLHQPGVLQARRPVVML